MARSFLLDGSERSTNPGRLWGISTLRLQFEATQARLRTMIVRYYLHVVLEVQCRLLVTCHLSNASRLQGHPVCATPPSGRFAPVAWRISSSCPREEWRCKIENSGSLHNLLLDAHRSPRKWHLSSRKFKLIHWRTMDRKIWATNNQYFDYIKKN